MWHVQDLDLGSHARHAGKIYMVILSPSMHNWDIQHLKIYDYHFQIIFH
jgi:hypothetical protein